MDADTAAKLRKPFPAEVIGKLPRGGAKLDFVGHAAVTDRLLSVDPQWNWEPMALDAAGLPARDAEGALWIRLTICGVTRLGVSDPGDTNKVAIGDAIRNAAMRFGVALDLWTKDDLESQVGNSPRQLARRDRPQANPQTPGEHGHAEKVSLILSTLAGWADDDPRKARLRALRDQNGWPSHPRDYDRRTAVAVWNVVRGMDAEQSDQETPGAPGAVPADHEEPQGVLEVGETEEVQDQRNGGTVSDSSPELYGDGPAVGGPARKRKP